MSDRRRWEDYSQAEFAAALAASSDTVCAQCPHTKGQHFSAGPCCTVCDCPGFVARDEIELVSGLDGDTPLDSVGAPTLGGLAKRLQKLKKRGVTRGAMLYVVDHVWWEPETAGTGFNYREVWEGNGNG